MKKTLIAALVAGAVALPAAAAVPPGAVAGPYKNKGQCQSTLMHARNDVRQDGVTPPAGETWNSEVKKHYSCQQDTDTGEYYIVYTP